MGRLEGSTSVWKICFVHASKKKTNWKEDLPILEFAYNNAKHSTIGFSPVMLMYNFQLQVPMVVGLEKEKLAHAKDFLQDINNMLKIAKHNIQWA